MERELKRKLFHLTGLVYVAGFLLLPRPAYIGILAVALIVEVVFESLRLTRPSLNQWFLSKTGALVRDKEQAKVMGVLWMTLGVLLTAVLAGPPSVAVAAVSYLIFGDGIASLAGKTFGGPRWSSSQKRISGSLACFIACLFVGAIALRPEYDWGGVFVGALAATVLERGVGSLDDNVAVPAGSAVALMLWYGIKPYFLMG